MLANTAVEKNERQIEKRLGFSLIIHSVTVCKAKKSMWFTRGGGGTNRVTAGDCECNHNSISDSPAKKSARKFVHSARDVNKLDFFKCQIFYLHLSISNKPPLPSRPTQKRKSVVPFTGNWWGSSL